MHTAVVSPDGDQLLDTHSSLDRPLRTDLLRPDGTRVSTVAEADTSALDQLGWSPPEEIVVKAADGTTDLYGVLWHPPGFDPTRRYPLVQFIYGGPQHVIHPRDFLQTTGRVAHALAQLGLVVLSVDGRGTPERGKAFQDYGYGRFGQHQIPEHQAALEQILATRPYLDAGRVGIFGGSWGGYMTLRAMLTAPETYHVGVASYGVGDLVDHMARAIEPYMGDIKANRDGYEQASCLTMLDRLQGKLLLIHGSNDVNALLSATMKVVDGLMAADKPFDLLVVPEMEHAFVGRGSAYAIKRIGAYFHQHLVESG
jgi:dipeptidyl aminopeptidase/acylaminoacyl peptidase